MAVDHDDIKVGFLSHMFPSSLAPNAVPFMMERVIALSRLVSLEIVAPVSFFPFLRKKLPPEKENFRELQIWHPRYLALPSPFWNFRWLTYLHSLKIFFRNYTGRCDILHIEWIYPDAFAAVRFAKKKGIKTVGVVHGNEAIGYYDPRRHRQKYIEVLAALDKIIVVSKDLKNKLINEYYVEPDKIAIILNGVNLEKFRLGNKIKAREKLNLSAQSSIGVCVARLSEEKNLHILIQSVAKLQEQSPEIYIVGDGPLKKELLEQIDHYGVEQKVKLVGSVPHEKISLWLGACDFFCLPSQREGCPVVIHEALACGRPVISTTVGAIPDLIKDDRYGLLCEPNNVTAFADIMKKAMSMKWDRNTISAYGRQFTWDKMARETVKIYKSILNS